MNQPWSELRRRKFLAVSMGALFIMAIISAMASGERGLRFGSLDELKRYQEKHGYVWLGRFGNNWPARVIEVRSQQNQIAFQLSDGSRHDYPGFDGFHLKLIRLRGNNGKENVIIFRSQERGDNLSGHTDEFFSDSEKSTQQDDHTIGSFYTR